MARRLLAAGADLRAYDVDERALAAVVDAGARRASAPEDAARDAAVRDHDAPGPGRRRPRRARPRRAARRPGAGRALARDVELAPGHDAGARRRRGRARRRAARRARQRRRERRRGGHADDHARRPGGARRRAPARCSRSLGDALVHVGDRPGDGDAAKTINNMLSATNLAAAAEALAMGMRPASTPSASSTASTAAPARRTRCATKVGGHVLTGRFGSRFTLGQYLKDLGIARGLADDHASRRRSTAPPTRCGRPRPRAATPPRTTPGSSRSCSPTRASSATGRRRRRDRPSHHP